MGKSREIVGKFTVWRLKHIPERGFIFMLSFIVGAVSGITAVLLKNIIHYSIEFIEHYVVAGNGYLYLLLPLIGISMTYLFVRYFVKDNISHGVTRVLYAISKKDGFLKPHNTWTSMLASTLTISFGGSVGAEAPVVLTGSAIGSTLARFFKLNSRQITLMVGCGAAGAIAGIFKAPLTGLLFTLEVLMLDLTMASLIPLMISAVTATTVAYFFMGDSALVSFHLDQVFTLENIGYYIVLGIFCGIVAFYFTRATMYFEGLFKKVKTPFVKLLIGASALSLLVFLFPSLWGEGYNSLRTLLHGEGATIFNHTLFNSVDSNSILFLILLLAIMIFKVIAMAATNGAGGVGGIFAPTLLVGGFAGFFIVHTLNSFGLDLPESNFTLAGMSGLMAGVMHAPMTAIFLIAELTGGYDMILPLILTATVSYITIMIFEPHSIYTKRLAKRGELLTHHKDKNVLIMLDIHKLIEKEFIEVCDDMTLGEFVKEVTKSKRNIFPVLSEGRKLVGVVLLENIRPFIFNRDMYDTTYVNEFMIAPPAIVEHDENMEAVMKKFKQSKAWNLPVVENGNYIGFLSKSKIFNEYRDVLLHYSDE